MEKRLVMWLVLQTQCALKYEEGGDVLYVLIYTSDFCLGHAVRNARSGLHCDKDCSGALFSTFFCNAEYTKFKAYFEEPLCVCKAMPCSCNPGNFACT